MLLRFPRLRPLGHLATRLTLVNGVQLLLLAGSLSWLSYSLGRQSGLAISESYRQSSTVQELSERLSQRLRAPRTINALNLLEIRDGEHRLDDYEHFARVFWRQMQVFPVAYINLGTADGAFIGVERTDDGQLLLNEDTPRRGRGVMAVHRLGPGGTRGRLVELIPGMTSVHTEPWYAETARSGRPTWSSIYAWEDKPEVFSIAYNVPVYGADRRLRGVIGVDMVLSQLSTWLNTIWRDQDGLALIVELDGRLVASSRPSDTLKRSGGRVRRNDLGSLSHPLARALLTAKFQRLDRRGSMRLRPGVMDDTTTRPVTINGRRYFIDASPWGREEGLNWVLLTALPADPQTRSNEHSASIALLASVLALALAVLLGDRLIRELLRPLQQLQREAARLESSLSGEAALPLHYSSGISPQDSDEMRAVDATLRQLVERFNRLTSELQSAMERERERDAHALAQLRTKLNSSLQAAAVAHEINQPLSVLLLNSQLLLEQVRSAHDLHLPAAWRHQLQGIAAEADRVVLTIEKMRTLLRNVQTIHRRLNLHEVCRSAVLYARSSGLDSGLELDSLSLEANAEPAWIEGDAEQIQIAILNLLRNAAEALRGAATDAAWIGVDLQRCGQEWRLRVQDNGPGYPGGSAPAEPLDTTKPDGSGLGLFVVRTTMANHRGRLTLEARPQGGAEASLFFPAIPARDDSPADLPSSSDPRSGD